MVVLNIQFMEYIGGAFDMPTHHTTKVNTGSISSLGFRSEST